MFTPLDNITITPMKDSIVDVFTNERPSTAMPAEVMVKH